MLANVGPVARTRRKVRRPWRSAAGHYNGKPAVILCGADSRGLMYAALDTADRVSGPAKSANPFEHIRDTIEKPYLAHRAVSMYTMQRAYFESRLYDEAYWRRYFDMLAADRINSFIVIFGYENGGFMAPAVSLLLQRRAVPRQWNSSESPLNNRRAIPRRSRR